MLMWDHGKIMARSWQDHGKIMARLWQDVVHGKIMARLCHATVIQDQQVPLVMSRE